MENNEDFASMLNQYITDEELSKYADSDEENNNLHKTDSPFEIEDTITLAKYVNHYLGLNIDCTNLWHTGLEELLNEYGIKESIPIASNITNANPELVYQGYVLIVMDPRRKNNRKDYINPEIIREILNENNLKQQLEKTDKESGEYLDILYRLERIKSYNEVINLVQRKTKLRELKEQNDGGKKL